MFSVGSGHLDNLRLASQVLDCEINADNDSLTLNINGE